MITKTKFWIEQVMTETNEMTTLLLVGDMYKSHVVCTDVRRATDNHSAVTEIHAKLADALGQLMRGEQEDPLGYVVVGRDRCGGHPEADLVYSVSGQWSDDVDRAQRMSLGDAQAFVAKYPGNVVRHVRGLVLANEDGT